MADQTLKTLHPFLQENDTKLSSGGTLKSYSHDLGSGPVMCVVHGWPQSSYMWRHVVPAWKDSISLFIPELPGYGFSSLPPGNKHDKRTVGNLIIEGLHLTFGKTRPIIWCGHDRGARIGHRLLVDNVPIKTAILMDIVPTLEQWKAFANPLASKAYYHWPFLAIPNAPTLIEAMGPGEFTRINLQRSTGSGTESFRANDAVEVYAKQFSNPECIAGSCGDYAAGATVDVEEQEEDLKEGRKVKAVPLMVIYSAGNLGRMHDVEGVWRRWIDDGEADVRFEGIGEGFGHYLPEECPEKIANLVGQWVGKYGK